ncbi:hypothetical protein DYB32_002262 [Aphanomyces invadans]|uniref:Uncharacterized protein n=1 Tax=Aphanomyces invadans TaxID=157072 RepID=A0A418B3T2_9STRA|nr:hypothetical protein DYB32_002262 [Aphanomyces invadans]
MSADIHVKDTVFARDSSGKRLPQHVFEGPNWAALKETIFLHCLPHVQFRATYTGDPRVWSVDSEKSTLSDFESLVSIKMGRYFFKLQNDTHAMRYITEHQADTFTVSIFKWGNHVSTATDLQTFQEQCIFSQAQDRAGAAAESAHNEMIRRLKEKWGMTYTSYEANWRMWASRILKLPVYQHDMHVANPPPEIMLHLFEPVPNGAQQRNQSLQRSMTVALDIVDSCLDGLGSLKRLVSDVVLRIEADESTLSTKRRVIEGFLQEITPIAVRPDLIDLLRSIPNADDEEHIEA